MFVVPMGGILFQLQIYNYFSNQTKQIGDSFAGDCFFTSLKEAESYGRITGNSLGS